MAKATTTLYLRKTAILFVFLTFFVFFASAQKERKDEIREQITTERIAFYSKSLNLTKKEAREFWPIYNDFEQKKEKTISETRDILREYKESENLSAGEYIRMADRFVYLKKREATLYDELNQSLKKIFPPKKIIQLYYTEQQFKKHLIRQLRNY
jgi:hypothetical protein